MMLFANIKQTLRVCALLALLPQFGDTRTVNMVNFFKNGRTFSVNLSVNLQTTTSHDFQLFVYLCVKIAKSELKFCETERVFF